MPSLFRTFFLTLLIATTACATTGFAADDEAAAAAALEAKIRGLDPRPEARMPIAELERRMAAGELGAQAELGARFGAGYGVKQDLAKAIALLRPAADKGNADAQYFLGSAYAAGQGVPQNDVQAFMLFEQAAGQGHPGGNYMMAIMLINGRAGLSPSWSGSIGYLWAAATKDYVPAMFLLGAAYEDGAAGMVNPRAAAYWYRRYLAQFPADPRVIYNLRRMIMDHRVPYETGDPGDPLPAEQNDSPKTTGAAAKL